MVLLSFCILLFAVLAAINLVFFIRKEEDMGKSLLDGCDASGIVAAYNVFYFFGKCENSFFYDLAVLDNIDRNVMVNKRDT